MSERWQTTKEIEYQELKSEADALRDRQREIGLESIGNAAGALFMEATAYISYQIDQHWGWQENLFASVGALMLYYSGTQLREYIKMRPKVSDKAFDVERLELELEMEG